MALTVYLRTTDELRLIQDANLAVVELFYPPGVDNPADLSIGDGDPLRPGAIASVTSGGKSSLWIYNGDGTWSQVGSESGPSYTPDPSLPSGAGFLAYLRTNYASAKPGDVVYREGTTQLIKCTCYYVDANPALNKWSKIIETIE